MCKSKKITISILAIISMLLFITFWEITYKAFAVDQSLKNGMIGKDYVWETTEDSIIITNCHNNITATIKDEVCYVDANDSTVNTVEEFAVSKEIMSNWSESEYELFSNLLLGSNIMELYYSDNIITVRDSVIACDMISKVNFGNTVKCIDDYTFAYSSVEDVEFSNSLEKIGEYAFGECGVLTDVVLPSSVNEIGRMAFFDCSNLKNVVIYSKNADIQEFAFGYHRGDSEKLKISDFTITGYSGSTAEAYANENGFTFIAFDEPISTTTTQVNQITSTSTTVTTTTISSNTPESTSISIATSTTTVTSDIQTTTTQTSSPTSTVDEASTTSRQTIITTQRVNPASNGNANNSKGSSSSSPKTGDSFPIVSVLTAIGISAVSTVLFMKRRK